MALSRDFGRTQAVMDSKIIDLGCGILDGARLGFTLRIKLRSITNYAEFTGKFEVTCDDTRKCYELRTNTY